MNQLETDLNEVEASQSKGMSAPDHAAAQTPSRDDQHSEIKPQPEIVDFDFYPLQSDLKQNTNEEDNLASPAANPPETPISESDERYSAYVETIEQTHPLKISLILGTPRQTWWCVAILLIYAACIGISIAAGDLSLSQLDINDFFVRDSASTQKYFVELKTNDAFSMYLQYVTNTWFMQEANFDRLIKTQEFTNFHAQLRPTSDEEYKVKIRVKEVEQLLNLSKAGRRLTTEGSEETKQHHSNLTDGFQLQNETCLDEILLRQLQQENEELAKRKIIYNVTNMPPGVDIRDVKMQQKLLGRSDHNIIAIFKCKGECETVLNYKNLLEMRRFTSGLTAHPLWAMFCPRDLSEPYADGNGCTENAYVNLTSQLSENLIADWKDKSQEEINEKISSLAYRLDNDLNGRGLLHKDFHRNNPVSPLIASIFKTTNDVFESRIRQTQFGFWEEQITKTYVGEELQKKRLELGQMAYDYSQNFKSDTLEVIAFTWSFQDKETTRLFNQDFIFVGFVLLACIAYMAFHTGSLFLGIANMLNVLCSVFVSIVVYSHIFQIKYFSTVNMSVLFIIIGIGADDIFVFHDFWKQTFNYKGLRAKPIHRISMAFRRASASMLVTSLTSAISFLACTLSSIVPVQAFGWFASLIVTFAYFLTVLVQPVMYYVYEKYLVNRGWKDKWYNHFMQGQVADFEDRDHIRILPKGDPAIVYEDFEPLLQSQAQILFRNKLGKIIFRLRYLILVTGLALYALDIWCMATLTTSSQPDAILKQSHPIQKALTWGKYELWQDTKIDINFVWGVKPQLWLDPSQNRWKAQTEGMLELDPTFNPASE